MRYGLKPQKPEEATIRVRMQRTTQAQIPGGNPIVIYEAGQEYDLPEWLAQAFFKGGEADPAEAHEQPVEAAPQPQADAPQAALVPIAVAPAPKPQAAKIRRAGAK